MYDLPIISKKYFPDGVGGANVTLSYWYEPQEEDLLKQRGGLGLLISLMGPDDFSGERAAKFVWDSYQEAYYFAKGSVKDAMRSAVKSAQNRLVDLIKNEEVVSEQGVELHLCAFAVHGEEVYVSMIGNPSVALLRGGDTISISEILPSYTGTGIREEVPVGSFALEQGDILMLSTPKLVDSFLEVFSDEDSPPLESWDQCIGELDLFSENMAGNQFLVVLGYKIPETELSGGIEGVDAGGDVKAKDKGLIEGPDDDPEGEDAAKGEKGEETDENEKDMPKDDEDEKERNEKGAHTPGGIYSAVTGGVAAKWSEHIKPKIEKVDVQGTIKEGTRAVRDKRLVSGIKRKIGSWWSGIKLGGGRKRRMVLGEQKSGIAKITGSSLFIPAIIVIVVGLLGFNWWSGRQEMLRQEEINGVISQAETLVNEGRTAWEVDKDRDLTESKLEESTAVIETLSDDELNEKQQENLEDLRNEIQGIYDMMNRVSPLSEDLGTIEILTDLYLKIGEDAEVTDFEKYGKSLYLVDKTSHTIYKYIPGQDSISPVANSSEVLKSPEYIAIGDGIMFVYDTEVGIVILDMNVSEPDWTFDIRPELSARTLGQITELAAFADSVYILKADEARVMKSFPAGSGYSYPEEYFRNGSFDKAVDIAIDGSIYVFSNASEKIYKYFGGQQDNFTLSGLIDPLGVISCGTSNLNDSSNLFVFDAENKRIVSIEKGTADKHPGVGVMLRQYLYRGARDDIFSDVREIVVDVDERMLYVLDGTRVLQVLLEDEQ
jgi:hypothetical protein